MNTRDADVEKTRDLELKIMRQVAFASGLFQGDVTVRTLLESLPEGIVIIDSSGTILLVNNRTEQIFGYAGQDLIGKPYAILIPERFRKVHQEHLAHFLDEPKLRPMGPLPDLVGLRQDGSEFPLEISLSFIETVNGALALVFISDVTLQKQVQTGLREEIEPDRHRILLEEAEKLARVGAWEWDIVENRFHMSQEWLRIHGSDDPNPSREALMLVAHPEDRDAIMHAFNDSIEKGIPYDIVHRIVRPSDGGVRVIQAYGYVMKDSSGTPIRMYGAAQDITERRRAEDALRESECRYSALFASKISGIAHCRVITDDQGRPVDYLILQINEAYEQIVGIKKADIEGRRVREVFPGVENFSFDYIGVLGNIALQGGDIKFESFLETTQQYLSIYAYSPLPGEFTAIFTDITERKNAEGVILQKQRQLEELNRTLEKRVADAVADSRQKDQILIVQGRQAAMGEMIGNVAHQWRQPLNMLGLIVQELRMTYGRDEFSEESLEASVKKAMALINHMSRTIDDFSNYFKPDIGKTLFNVNKAVAMTLSLVEPGMKKLNIDINVTEKDDIEISGYANEYSQVLLNILLNSRDAFEGRQIDMPRVIEIILLRAENNRSVVTIADNAGGIPVAVIDKIFDPYFTTKGPDKGTGIGLFMAKTIIEKNMKGKLTVRNIKDGAEFRIEL